MPLKTSGSGCGGFLLGWCLLFGILTLLAGLGRWGLFGTVVPGYWVIVLLIIVQIDEESADKLPFCRRSWPISHWRIGMPIPQSILPRSGRFV